MQAHQKEKTDLELYFKELVHPNVLEFHFLHWWKVNETKCKVLSKIAMDILSIPMTTLTSESTFSACGRVIDKNRASMRRDTIEVLYCSGDWIKEVYVIRSARTSAADKTNEESKENVEVVPKPKQKTKSGHPSSKLTKSKQRVKKKVQAQAGNKKVVNNMTCLFFWK
ncbi:hypothetical protein LIER_34527 [Lithospermum erythrorhizon]|uniref:HAT C-terminal dimerisation domain-containing protein n=1 Tax=Lithospermum erythrorhizon TaxID=34254 RepID=A0AAV3S0J9_LITER